MFKNPIFHLTDCENFLGGSGSAIILFDSDDHWQLTRICIEELSLLDMQTIHQSLSEDTERRQLFALTPEGKDHFGIRPWLILS